MNEYEDYGRDCLAGSLPSCACTCPLNLDIPKIITPLQRGNIDAAYKRFRDQSVFPKIVSMVCSAPCKDSCCRKEIDAPVNLLTIEKLLCDFASDITPPQFNLPPRKERIVVIGAGLSGLACALRLGRKGYDVAVYEAEDHPGGRTTGMMDQVELFAEIENQMMGARVLINYRRDVESLDNLEFDAAYIATGSGGRDFGLLDRIDANSLSTTKQGVFLGGALIGAKPVYDVADGVRAAYSIEKYIKTGLMDGVAESFAKIESEIVMDLSHIVNMSPTLDNVSCEYTKDELVLEAGRCLKCDCTLCRDACELFDYFQKSPRQIIGDAIASQHTGDFAVTKQTTTQVVSSCNLCGLCGKVCPKGIDIGMMAHDFRHFKRLALRYPPAYADYYLRDMEFSNSEAAYVRGPGDDDTNIGSCSYMFFPGCQLGADNPAYVSKAYRYLCDGNPETAIMLACCGAPADWGGEAGGNEAALHAIRSEWEARNKPVFVCACTTCMKQFALYLPEVKTISLYEIMAGSMTQECTDSYAISIFDPCTSRDFPQVQESVRDIVLAHGLQINELPYSGQLAQCCGAGAQTLSANPDLAGIMINNRISGNGLPYICYCVNCKDTFNMQGKSCFHVLDLFFGFDSADHVIPTLDERRSNKLETKCRIAKEFFGEMLTDGTEEARETGLAISLDISIELLAKLKMLLVREQEIVNTVSYCETTGNKLYDKDRDVFIGHHKDGLVTFWVEYKRDSDKYILVNAYTHRIEIMGEEGRDD